MAAFRSGPAARKADEGTRRARIVGFAAVLALVVVLAMIHLAEGDSSWLYPFGFVGLDLAIVVTIATVMWFPGSLVGRLLSLRPLRAVGQISYGIYLWHFPLFLWLTASSIGLGGTPLLIVRVTVTLVVAVVSFFLLEEPVRRRRVPSKIVLFLAPFAVAVTIGLLALSSALAAKSLAPVTHTQTASSLRGTAAACTVPLTDTSDYGLAPMTAQQAVQTEKAWLGASKENWSRSASVKFNTCPPKRAMIVGDSLGFAVGLATMVDEQNYGVEIANASILGCAFAARGELDARGSWQTLPAGCPDALTQWAREERVLHPQVVIVELGYRDEFDWKVGGHIVHLGQPSYDAYVERRIDDYVKTLGQGAVKVLFLSVPWTDPPTQANGSPSAPATAARHAEINSMIESAVRRYPDRAALLNIDTVLSPGNRYQATVNGKLCRLDGIHPTIYCGQLLQPLILGQVRSLIES
jgi:hypothetical protein